SVGGRFGFPGWKTIRAFPTGRETSGARGMSTPCHDRGDDTHSGKEPSSQAITLPGFVPNNCLFQRGLSPRVCAVRASERTLSAEVTGPPLAWWPHDSPTDGPIPTHGYCPRYDSALHRQRATGPWANGSSGGDDPCPVAAGDAATGPFQRGVFTYWFHLPAPGKGHQWLIYAK